MYLGKLNKYISVNKIVLMNVNHATVIKTLIYKTIYLNISFETSNNIFFLIIIFCHLLNCQCLCEYNL